MDFNKIRQHFSRLAVTSPVWKQHSSSLCTKSELNKLNTAASCSKDYSVQKNVWQSAPGYVIGRKASHPTARCWLNYVFFVFVVDTKSATSVLWRLLFFFNHKLFLLFMFKKKTIPKSYFWLLSQGLITSSGSILYIWNILHWIHFMTQISWGLHLPWESNWGKHVNRYTR